MKTRLQLQSKTLTHLQQMAALLLSLMLSHQAASTADHTQTAIAAAVANPSRTAEYAARDKYRHPVETLAFMGVTPSSTVVEIWPGRGWYTEILAPLLAQEGIFYAAHFDESSAVPYFRNSREQFAARVASEAGLFAGTQITEFAPPDKIIAAPEGSADFVLTFRNVHNWMKAGSAEQAFIGFARMLKPGGVLGVVEHRALPGTSEEQMIKSGYVTEERVIELARQAGLTLQARSEINSNPSDGTQHPAGVWTLPPSLRMGDEKRAHYQSIGESDRMTLRFVKAP